MKHVVVFALIAGGVVAGFYAGRLSPGRDVADEPKAASVGQGVDASKLAKAEQRIAELERKLAAAKKDAAARKLAAACSDAANGVSAVEDGVVVMDGTNVDIVAELKKRLPEDEFVNATNAMTRIRTKMAEKAQDRMWFLKSVDTSAMTQNERERHERFIELIAKREAVMSKMKLGLPDQQTLQEMMEVEMQLRPLAKAERAALSRELARELGYSGEQVDAVEDAVGNIFDCTAGGLDGMMDAADGTPGVEIGTDVQVLSL